MGSKSPPAIGLCWLHQTGEGDRHKRHGNGDGKNPETTV
jgi:hypothetical protein